MVLISESEEYSKPSKGLPGFLEYVRQRKLTDCFLSGLNSKSMEEEALQQILEEEYPVVYIGKKISQEGINVYAQYESYRHQMIKNSVCIWTPEDHPLLLQRPPELTCPLSSTGQKMRWKIWNWQNHSSAYEQGYQTGADSGYEKVCKGLGCTGHLFSSGLRRPRSF